MPTKKVKCKFCGGLGYNAAFVNGKTITSPCGGCNGTGYEIVTTSSDTTSKGCMLFFTVFMALGITFIIVKYLI